MSLSDNAIRRDGFRSAYGRFYADPWGVEIVQAGYLRSMFLPTMTPGAKDCLRENADFIRGRLKHYDVDYDEDKFWGSGTALFKKLLAAGKCDKVPDHISRLREQMHMEWLDQLTPDEMANYPEWIMQRYFLDASGKPDTTKTKSPVGFPLPRHSQYRASQVLEAATKVYGLRHSTGFGDTQTIYLGWDQAAVDKAAKGHAAKEARSRKAKETEREEERASAHAEYLAEAKRSKGAKESSPVGGYIVRN
ncbi:Uu.00g039120.m01.CDS01 [Anthostomella pinea]|uniref:Uu.00g039120.m01.CDS01 n=1 Tax=Anthostomella pinea TaxID=933095 RepID=A0AAI8YBE1_9PEZI|nr:Uu.00g039120.m01.CDS01 [Anthostomella pinea]